MAKVNRNRKARGSSRVDMRALGIAAALLVATVLTTVFWVVPAYSSNSDKSSQATSVANQVATARRQIAQLKAGQASNAGALLTQARTLDAQLPTSVDKVALAASIPQKAQAAGLTVTRMDPSSDPVKLGAVSALTFSVGVTGPLAQVQSFLTDLTSTAGSSLLGVSDLAVTTAEGKTTATFTLSAYFSADAPLPAGAK